MACKRKPKFLEFPIWSLCFYKSFALVTGGGGGKKFGIRNKLMVFKSPSMELVKEEDTGEELLSCLGHLVAKDLIIGAISKDIAVYKITQALEIRKITRVASEKNKSLSSLRAFNNETRLITSGEDGIISIWAIDSANSITKLLQINAGVEISCSDAKGSIVCAALKNKTCGIYCMVTGCKLKSLQFGEDPAVPMMFKACFFVDNYLFTLETGVKSGGYVSKWRVEGENVTPVESLKITNGAASYLRISKSGTKAGVGSSDGSVSVIDLKNMKMVFVRQEFEMPATCLDFNKNENGILVGAADYSYSFMNFGSMSWLNFLCIAGVLVIFISYWLF